MNIAPFRPHHRPFAATVHADAHTVCACGTRKKTAYNTGTTISVRTVANARPNMMVTAARRKQRSAKREVRPQIYVRSTRHSSIHNREKTASSGIETTS